MLGLNIIVFPLLLVRDISSLRYFNLIGFISVFYTAAVITFEASSYHDYYFDEDKDSFKLAGASLTIFECFSISLYIFYVHFAIFIVKDEMYNPTEKRLSKIFKRSVFIEMLIYLVIGNFGYYSMG
jgi:amino acid permease